MAYKKGESGNLNGRPKGTCNAYTALIKALQLKYEPEALKLFYKRAAELAEEGDLSGLRDIYRDSTRHRSHVISINLTGSLQEQIKTIGEAANEGRLTPNEVLLLMSYVEKQAKIYEVTEMKEKVDWLMGKQLEKDSEQEQEATTI